METETTQTEQTATTPAKPKKGLPELMAAIEKRIEKYAKRSANRTETINSLTAKLARATEAKEKNETILAKLSARLAKYKEKATKIE